MSTPFEKVYKSFYSRITDDMFLEMTKDETDTMLLELLETALPWFEFPRVDLYDQDEITYQFNADLSQEEINIIAIYMVVAWVGQQLASIENTRMKYSGNDFKFTSQANHMAKLSQLKQKYEQEGFALQRLYKRRLKDENGIFRPTLGSIMNTDDN
jgi:hypothetical protein